MNVKQEKSVPRRPFDGEEAAIVLKYLCLPHANGYSWCAYLYVSMEYLSDVRYRVSVYRSVETNT